MKLFTGLLATAVLLGFVPQGFSQTHSIIKITNNEAVPIMGSGTNRFSPGYIEGKSTVYHMQSTGSNSYGLASRSKNITTGIWNPEQLSTSYDGSWAYYGSQPNGSFFFVNERSYGSAPNRGHYSDGYLYFSGTTVGLPWTTVPGNKNELFSKIAIRFSPDQSSLAFSFKNSDGNVLISSFYKNNTEIKSWNNTVSFGMDMPNDIIPMTLESGYLLYWFSTTSTIKVYPYTNTGKSSLVTLQSQVNNKPIDLKGIAKNATDYFVVYTDQVNSTYYLKVLKISGTTVTTLPSVYSSSNTFGDYKLIVDTHGLLNITFHEGSQIKYTREKDNGNELFTPETVVTGMNIFNPGVDPFKTNYSLNQLSNLSLQLVYLSNQNVNLLTFSQAYRVKVDQKLADGINSFDKVAQINEGVADWQTAPNDFFVNKGTTGVFQASSEMSPAKTEKFYEWDGNQSWSNQYSFIPVKPTDLKSQFKTVTSGGQLTLEVEGISVSSSAISFLDPWYEVNGVSLGTNATFQPVTVPFDLSVNGSIKGVFNGLVKPTGTDIKPFYAVKAEQNQTWSGLDISFQKWTTSGASIPSESENEQPVTFLSSNATVTANYKAMLTSKTGNWVQSVTPYTANGTRAVAYFSPNPDGDTGIWFHQETGAVAKEVNITSDNWLDLTTSANLISVAVADYNKQKSYLGYIGNDPGYQKLLSVREVINGVETGFTQTMPGIEDPVVNGFSSNAKIYITPYVNNTGWPVNFSQLLVVVVDGLTVYTRNGAINGGLVNVWQPWSSFTVNSTPVFSTNGKTPYINWLQNGNLVGRRFVNSSWGSTYTLYSNTGGNFVNFTAAVNSTDDLVLMMTRQNSGSQAKSMCFGKRYNSGSSAPVTVLETTTYGGYSAYALASEDGKLLVSVGKTPDGETPMSYFLWKNDGTSWTKETTAFSSTPARLLHNEVDVRPYEFVTSTTPALYALKTSPVSWPSGNPGMNKEGDENGFSIVAAQIGDTLNWYTTVSPEAVDSIVVDSTGIWSIVVNQVSAKNILISGLNRFGSAIWVDTSSTVLFAPATARYTFWVVDPAGNKMRYHKESSESDEAEFVLENKISVFPNPFNPATVFSISVAEPSTVKLHVFNLIGQQIAEVVNADLNAGVHDYRLNAGSWSSGTYFYRLQIGEKTKTGKIQLVK